MTLHLFAPLRLADAPLRPQYEHQWWALAWEPEKGDRPPEAVAVAVRRWGAFMRASADPALRAWQRGETGYPLVDAAMRELWITGYIPNYMRHVVRQRQRRRGKAEYTHTSA